MVVQRSKIFVVGGLQGININHLNSFDLPHQEIDVAQGLTEFDLSQGSSIVFNLSSGKLSALLNKIQTIVIPALNHGLEVIALCKLSDINTINCSLIAKDINKQITTLAVENKESYQLEKCLIRKFYHQSPRFNVDCKITIDESQTLSPDCELFFKRAFSDFKEIHLKQLSPGFSASGVYCVHVLSPMLDMGRTTPFFAKLDTREKIIREMENYQNHVLPAIPFNLRPNIDENRCILGAKYGLLVGNFVENSVSLWSLISQGHARSAIYSLFDNALYAWRYPINALSSDAPLFFLESPSSDAIKTLKQRHKQAKEFCKSILEPTQLLKALNNLPLANFVKTRIHGDLHTENICSRNGEAILIDFASVKYGPPSMDPTALEVWIAFFKWPHEVKDFEKWRNLIDELYFLSPNGLSVPKLAHEPKPWTSIWNSIRQIRSIAFSHMEEDRFEYIGCVSYWLFRFANYSNQNPDSEMESKVRAYAYLLASKIASNFQNYKFKASYVP